MIEKTIRFLGLGKMGWLEFIIALFPILAGYSYGSFRLSFGVLLLLDILIIIKGNNKLLRCLPFVLFSIYLVLHDTIFLIVYPFPSYFVNSLILSIIYAISIFVITPQIDFEKFRTSIFFVTFVCMLGMIYHVALISAGKSVSPIKLPFLPEMAQNTRLYEISQRPLSFFWEPQSYASFMLAPLFFAIYERKILYAVIIAALMMASTSTTGLILSLLMFLLSLASNRNKWYTSLFVILAVMALCYFLVSSSYTIAGLEKFQNTNIEESNRISNGLLAIMAMDASDYLIGIPFANVQDAYEMGYFGSSIIVYSDGILYLPAFWIALVQYGIFGLILFLCPYFWIYKRNHRILPYLVCVVAGHFSNPDFFGGAAYTFQIMVMIAFVCSSKKRIKQFNHEGFNSNISVR